MDHSIANVQNVLRNYQGILTKKRGAPPSEEPLSKQNVKVDRISVSKEALDMLEELKASNPVDKQKQPRQADQTTGGDEIGTKLV